MFTVHYYSSNALFRFATKYDIISSLMNRRENWLIFKEIRFKNITTEDGLYDLTQSKPSTTLKIEHS